MMEPSTPRRRWATLGWVGGHEELARFAAIGGKTWNTPTIADGRLFVRNTTEMAAFSIAP